MMSLNEGTSSILFFTFVKFIEGWAGGWVFRGGREIWEGVFGECREYAEMARELSKGVRLRAEE